MFSEELFLTTKTGKYLYHTYAEKLPIIDYHCHLQPKEIYENNEFEDLGEMWLRGDHYKWRCMRTFGIDEKYITGNGSYYEKYMAFAKILPKLMGNPIYIWCALELKRYFGIDEPLSEKNAQEIYDKTKQMIIDMHMTRQYCMEMSNVQLVSTTEDPTDDLWYHKELKKNTDFKVKVISAFRPDQAMLIKKNSFSEYMKKLSLISDTEIKDFKSMLDALEKRLLDFKEIGTTVSDNGIPYFQWEDYTEEEIGTIWKRATLDKSITQHEENQYRSAFIYEMARMYHRNGFVMQLHVGTYLDANTKGVAECGQSAGFDCIDDNTSVKSIGILLNKLTLNNEMPKTILYPLDGTKIEAWTVLAAGFCENGTKAKCQLGAPWWFMDQPYGIMRQFEACANLYPIALSVGMLTDSRSFISYPRHEVYRRILCDYFGKLIERGEYFHAEEEIAKIIEDICLNNVKDFFGFKI